MNSLLTPGLNWKQIRQVRDLRPPEKSERVFSWKRGDVQIAGLFGNKNNE